MYIHAIDKDGTEWFIGEVTRFAHSCKDMTLVYVDQTKFTKKIFNIVSIVVSEDKIST